MFRLDLEKAEEPEIKMPTSTGSWKKQESSRKTSISALLTMPKPLTVWITINSGKFLKKMGLPDQVTCLLRNLYACHKATGRTGHGKKKKNWTWNNRLVPNRKMSMARLYIVTCLFNFYAEYIMRNTGLKHKLESRLLGEISVTSDMQMTPPYGRK